MKIRLKNKILNFVDNNAFISRILRFLKIRNVQEKRLPNRLIYVNNIKPNGYNAQNEPLKYVSNKIKTSKFTIPDPPVSPYANLIPIVFVILVTMFKQGYEDILKHRSDREINNYHVRILKNGKFENRKWKNINAGDIVEVLADQTFPCDLLLLHAHSEDLTCHITTANLDGETNLKPRSKPRGLPILSTEEELSRFEGVIQCDKPNSDLYNFNGKIIVEGKELPIFNDNILLRGCNLKIAPIVYGCAIYTGIDTKIFKNTKFKNNKLSCIEKRLNKFVFVFLFILFTLVFTCFGGTFAYNFMYDTVWYLDGRSPPFYQNNIISYYFTTIVLYMNIFNYIIPLSLYVTVELQRFVGSKFLEWDLDLYDPLTDQPAKANTSDLNEDLGQIEYLFSDKTGTLTENQMIFKQFSIDGIIYEYKGTELFIQGSKYPVDIFQNEKMVKLFQVLSLCHTVHVDNSTEERYQASSPDEFSFVKFCAKLGLVYEGEQKCTESSVMIRKVKYKETVFKYKVLNILDFDSDRKRMSVILKDLQEDRIILLCKGAESSIFKNCSDGNLQSCDNDIKLFAKQGWRTLAISYRYLTNQEYKTIKQTLKQAYNDINNRKEKVANALEEIESKLILVGATAVEDKLQEDVAFTLEELRRAGIKIWVLTGDKRETAINISHSCKHFSENMIKILITDITEISKIKKIFNFYKKRMRENPNDSYALVIDGRTLDLVFKNNLNDHFRNICMKCEAVLCCRMTPVQKANIVRMVKKSKKKPMTAAIGDGANDVSMIQEANIGLGIFGKEGRNAARSADFAFAKFKFARKILLVHGYLYYTRSSSLVLYFFYKNLAFAVCQFYFAIFSAFSVSTLYNSIILMMYNVVFTSAPPLLYGLFEQKVTKKVLDKTPYLYQTIKRNKNLRSKEFMISIILGTWHSLVAFFFAYGLIAANACLASDGTLIGSTEFGEIVFTQIFLVVHLKLLIDWQHKNFFIIIGFMLSLFFYFLFCFIFNSFIFPNFMTDLTDGQSTYWTYNYLYGTSPFWLYLILATVVSLIPDVILKIILNYKDQKKVRNLNLKEKKRLEKLGKMEKFDIDNIKDLYEEDLKRNKKKRVRVFYVPTGLNKVYHTKVQGVQIDEKNVDYLNQNFDFNKSYDYLVHKNFHVNQRF